MQAGIEIDAVKSDIDPGRGRVSVYYPKAIIFLRPEKRSSDPQQYIVVLLIDVHRAKLEDFDELIIEAISFLFEKNRAAALTNAKRSYP